MPGFAEYEKHFSNFNAPYKMDLSTKLKIKKENAKIKRDTERLVNVFRKTTMTLVVNEVGVVQNRICDPCRGIIICGGDNHCLYVNPYVYNEAVNSRRIVIARKSEFRCKDVVFIQDAVLSPLKSVYTLGGKL